MANSSFVFFDHAIEHIGDGTIDLDGHTFAVALLSAGYTPSTASHSAFDELSAYQVTQEGYAVQLLQDGAWERIGGNRVRFDASDVRFDSLRSMPVKYAVLFDEANGKLVGYIDLEEEDEDGIEATRIILHWHVNGLFHMGEEETLPPVVDFPVHDFPFTSSFETGDLSEWDDSNSVTLSIDGNLAQEGTFSLRSTHTAGSAAADMVTHRFGDHPVYPNASAVHALYTRIYSRLSSDFTQGAANTPVLHLDLNSRATGRLRYRLRCMVDPSGRYLLRHQRFDDLGQNGANVNTYVDTTVRLRKGLWDKLTLRVAENSLGGADGVAQLYVNDVLSVSANLALRESLDVHVNQLTLSNAGNSINTAGNQSWDNVYLSDVPPPLGGIDNVPDPGDPGTDPGGAPTITQSLGTRPATQGSAFSLNLANFFSGATQYSATGLPPGLAVSGTSITGTPTAAGNFIARVTGTNSNGTITDSMAFVVADTGTLRAIPGVHGHGTQTTGGRGGTIYTVNTLSDADTGSGTSGSFRWCLGRPGPKIIVFEVGGVIQGASDWIANVSNTTIAGQTAPSPGITLRGAALHVRDCSNVVVQHLKIRVGDSSSGPAKSNRDASRTTSNSSATFNVVWDHCSISWAVDESVQIWFAGTRDVTYNQCIFAEALVHAGHPDDTGSAPGHSKGMIIGDGGIVDISVIRNVFAHCADRNPLCQQGSNVEVINNIVYNWGFSGTKINGGTVDVVNNYYRSGPNQLANTPIERQAGTVYTSGNNTGNGSGNAGSSVANRSSYSPLSAAAAFDHVRATVGAFCGMRDSHDTRVITHVTNGTGSWIDSQSQVGGWPSGSATRALSIPANPHGSAGNGYTNVEVWLQAYAAQVETGAALPGEDVVSVGGGGGDPSNPSTIAGLPFSDGFESGNLEGWRSVANTLNVRNPSNTLQVVTGDTPPNGGTYSLRAIQVSGSTYDNYIEYPFSNHPQIAGDAVHDLWLRVYSKFDTGFVWGANHSNDHKVILLNWTEPGVGRRNQVQIMANGVTGRYKVEVNTFSGATGTAYTISPTTQDATVRMGRWDKLTLHVVDNTPGVADGIVQLYVNDVLVINRSDLNIRVDSALNPNLMILSHYIPTTGESGTQRWDRIYLGEVQPPLGNLDDDSTPPPPSDDGDTIGFPFTEGFEGQNLSAWAASSGITIASGNAKNGSFAAIATAASGSVAAGYAEHRFGDYPGVGSVNPVTKLWFRVYHKLDATAFGSEEFIPIGDIDLVSPFTAALRYRLTLAIRASDSTYVVWHRRYDTNGENPSLVDVIAPSATTAASYREDKWDKLSLFVQVNTLGNSNGIVRLYVNDVLKIDRVNVPVRENIDVNPNRIRINNQLSFDNVALTQRWDDIYANSAQPALGDLDPDDVDPEPPGETPPNVYPNATFPYTYNLTSSGVSTRIGSTNFGDQGASVTFEGTVGWNGERSIKIVPPRTREGYSGIIAGTSNEIGTANGNPQFLSVQWLAYFGRTLAQHGPDNAKPLIVRIRRNGALLTNNARPMILQKRWQGPNADPGGGKWHTYGCTWNTDGQWAQPGDWHDLNSAFSACSTMSDGYRFQYGDPQYFANKTEEWVCIEETINLNTGQLRLYAWTQDRTVNGLQAQYTDATHAGTTVAYIEGIGWYWGNEGDPWPYVNDPDKYVRICRIRVAGEFQGPPTGF